MLIGRRSSGFSPKVVQLAAVIPIATDGKFTGTQPLPARAALGNRQPGVASMKIPFIVVFCGNEKYIFYYSHGKEEELVCRMIDYAMDDKHALGWPEVRSVMRHFGLLKMAPPAAGTDPPED